MNRIGSDKFGIALLALFLLLVAPGIRGQDKKPIVGIFLDNTGSLRRQHEFAIDIAKAVLRRTDPQSSVSVFGFASDPSPNARGAKIAAGLECATDRLLINAQLDGIPTVGGQTSLYDSIKVAVDRLGNAKPANCAEFSGRSLVIITDGEDRSSSMTAEELISFVKGSGIKTYIVGLVEDLDGETGFVRTSGKKRSQEFLEKLAKETQGSLVVVSKKKGPDEIAKKLFEPQSSIKK